MNDEPVIPLNLAGEPFEATRENSAFYTFVGRTVLPSGDSFENSTRNHVFLQTAESYQNENGQEVIPGMQIFGPEAIHIGTVMLRLQFPAHLNQTTIPEGDEQAFQRYSEQQGIYDLGDYLPEEFEG